jgi:hypothetical protein
LKNQRQLKEKTMLFETLETRKLFSVCVVHAACVPATPTTNSAVAADQKQIEADQVQLRKDNCSSAMTLLSDVRAMMSDGLRKDTTLMPLFQQLEADASSVAQGLKVDGQAEQPVVSADQSAIKTAEMQICKDKHNPTALAADQAALLAAQIQLQNDLITGLDARLATVQAGENTIADDLGSILGALSGDTTASPKLVTAIGTFRVDTLNAFNLKASDLLALIGARVQLVNDLMATQMQP